MWFRLYQKQTKQIKEKQTSVMAELAKVEPAVQEAKMGKLFFFDTRFGSKRNKHRYSLPLRTLPRSLKIPSLGN